MVRIKRSDVSEIRLANSDEILLKLNPYSPFSLWPPKQSLLFRVWTDAEVERFYVASRNRLRPKKLDVAVDTELRLGLDFFPTRNS